MTENVIVAISGLQYESEDGAVEMMSRGTYHEKNGKHYITYEEVDEELHQVNRCLLKISENVVELTKRGPSNVHMLFEAGNSNMTYYNTPYGQLLMTITTKEIKSEYSESMISIQLMYSLDMNYQHVSECCLSIRIQSI